MRYESARVQRVDGFLEATLVGMYADPAGVGVMAGWVREGLSLEIYASGGGGEDLGLLRNTSSYSGWEVSRYGIVAENGSSIASSYGSTRDKPTFMIV